MTVAVTPIHERRAARAADESRDAEEAREARRSARPSARPRPEAAQAPVEAFGALMAALLGGPSTVDAAPEAIEAATGSAEATTIAGAMVPEGIQPSAGQTADPAALAGAMAAGNAAAPSSDPPPVASRSLQDVTPELRARVARVLDRLEREHGVRAEVVETWRPQARQDALFAQGRTTDGPVVTWTRASAHTEGRAVDLRLAQPGAKGWEALQRIAQDEGLRTLGPMDPGHVELPGTGGAPTSSGGRGDGLAVPAAVARVADVAAVAGVAQVAEVAEVASVARVAVPGVPAGSSATTPAAISPADASAADAAVEGAASKGRREPSSGDGGSRRDGEPAGGGYGAHTTWQAPTSAAEAPRASAVPDAAAGLPGGVDVAARVEAIARARELQGARPLSRLVMDVPDGTGGLDRIAVSLRGARLDTALRLHDPAAVVQLSERGQLLARALESRGFQLGTLDVRARTASGDPAEALRVAAFGDPAAARAASSLLHDLAAGTAPTSRERAPSPEGDRGSPARQDAPDRHGGDARRQPRRHGAGAQ